MNFKDFHINIKIRLLENFVSSFLSNMIFPFMAIYLTNYYGLKVAGQLILLNSLWGIGCSLLGGYLSDRYGRRRILLISELLRILAFLIMTICNSPLFASVQITFLMMMINTLCWGLSGPANNAMLIDVSKPEERKLMYTISYWGSNLAVAIGGIIGAFLFKEYLFTLFIFLTIGSIFTFVLVYFFIQESYFPNEREVSTFNLAQSVKTYTKVGKDRLFILFTLTSVLLLSMEVQLGNYIGVKLSKDISLQKILFWHVDGLQVLGFLRTENTILVVILTLIAIKFIKQLSNKFLLFSGTILFIVGYIVISYSNNVWLLFLFMLIATLGEVVRVPIEQTYAAAMPPDNARSSYMAVRGLSYNLALLISALTLTVSGFLSAIGVSLFIAFTGIIAIFILVIIFNDLENRVNKSELPKSE